jgi:hypothetical protein
MYMFKCFSESVYTSVILKNQNWYNWLHNAQYCLGQSVCHGAKLHLTRFHVLFCVSRHLMPWHYQHERCILFLFSSCCLILTLQGWSILLSNFLYADICVFISTLFLDILNQCSLLWFRDQYQVWSFHRGIIYSVVFRAMASCRLGTVVPTFWRSMLPPVPNMKAVCLSKTWIPLYQIRSVISQKTMIQICI